MDDVDRLVIGVRADTRGFRADVAALKGDLEGSLGEGAARAGRGIETALLRAVRSGKLGFDDLKATALSALDGIAAAALKAGLGALFGGGEAKGLASVLAAALGAPGRATGGPVAPGRAYMVGERGPELFVPTASGRVETGVGAGMGAGARDVRVTITVNAGGGGSEAAAMLQRSSRQVARAVKAALSD